MHATATASRLSADQAGVRTLGFKALGTQCVIKFRLASERRALEFAAAALEWLGGFEGKFSRYQPTSLVSHINESAGKQWCETDAAMEEMLDIADDLFQRTHGVLDASMLPLLQVWDWKQARAKLPEPSAIQTALALSGWHKVQRRPGAIFLPQAGMGLDFGGFGKEFAVDRLIAIARQYGICDALVDLGRDIFALGGNGTHPFWYIGIEDGNKPGHCWGGLAVRDKAVCSSGDYARFFTHEGKRWGHILDPRTGWPVDNGLRAVTVVADSCLEAGIYSTTVFVLGLREGLPVAQLARGVEVCAQGEHGVSGSHGFGRWLVAPA
jgi:FAD:protein FMN transferase